MVLIGPPGQVRQRGKLNFGPCDPDAIENPYGLVPFREDTILFTLAVVPGFGVRIGPKVELVAFTKGDGEEDTDNGWPAGVKKTSSETLAFEKGALVERGENYDVEGMAIEVERPFFLDTPEGDPNVYALYNKTLDEYDTRIRDAFLTRTSVTYRHGKHKCDWELGKWGRWPTAGGPTHQIVSNGANSLIGMYLPLQATDASGAVDEPNKLTVKMRTGALGLEFENTANLELLKPVKVPVAITLYGRRRCAPCEPVCVPDGVPGEVAQAAVAKVVAGMSKDEMAAAILAYAKNKQNGREY